MRPPTHAQLEALARIKFWGAEVLGGGPSSPEAMAFLDTPHFTHVPLRITTLRRLIADGYVARRPPGLDEMNRDYIWEITQPGVAVLNEYPTYLASAGREASALAGASILTSLHLAEARAAAKHQTSE